MKIITLHTRIDSNQLLTYLQQKLNPVFKERRQFDLPFTIGKTHDAIEIKQPELYADEVLFRIETKDTEVWITRSEHYVDDVNSLTVESILNDVLNELSDEHGTDLLLEG